jgi:hypothetical protein
LSGNTTGSYNLAIGFTALASNITGNNNISIGYEALKSNKGNENFAIGYQALKSNISGVQNVAIGSSALITNNAGERNVAIGPSALKDSNSNDNVAIGSESLYQNTLGNRNTAIGTWTLRSNTTGLGNLAIGYSAMTSNVTGSNNISIGNQALAGTAEDYNVAIGNQALYSNSASYNLAIGDSSLLYNTTGTYNLGIGYKSLYSNTYGSSNVAIGNEALYSASGLNEFVNGNIAIGGAAGYDLTDGSQNIFIGGSGAGTGFTNGNYNVFIGNADVSAFDGLDSSIVISDGFGDIKAQSTSTNGWNFYGPARFGLDTYSKNMSNGDISLDNGTTDTPAILFYTANNTNWGIDSFYNGSSQVLRFVTDLNESGGTEKARIDSNGNFTSTNISDSGWTDATLAGTFVSGGTTPGYRRLNGVVYLRGNISGGTANTTAFTLPTGYRPAVGGTYPVQQLGTANITYITVNTNGTVVPNTSSAWLSGASIPLG